MTVTNAIDAAKEQDSVDSTALTSSMNEIQRLNIQLQMTTDFDANQTKHAETTYSYIQSLKSDLAETLALVENLNSQLQEYKGLEAKSQAFVHETLLHLESVKETAESLQADGIKAMKVYNFLSSELEKTKLQKNSLEELVSQLWVDLINARCNKSMKLEEVEHLESALEASELRYQKERVRSLMLICKAYEVEKQRKSEASQREAKLKSELKTAKDYTDVLEAKLMAKDTTYVKEQANESSSRGVRATEQLEEAHASKEAVEVLPTGNNEKYIAISSLFDSNYHSTTRKLCLSYSEDMDEDSSKKKNMLKRIGVLWKKHDNK